MGDRTTQIAREWLFKCANVVAECRDFPEVRSASTSGRVRIRTTGEGDDGDGAKGSTTTTTTTRRGRGRRASKSNRWFNLVTPRSVDVETALENEEDYSDDGRADGDAWTHRERLVVLDVRFGRDEEDEDEEDEDEAPPTKRKTMIDDALLERWVFHLGADGDKVGGNNHFNKDLDASVVYKRGVIMVRTLAALLRTLPSHGARLRALQRRAAHPSRSSVGGRFSFSVRDLDISSSIEGAHPGKSAGYRTYAFTDVATSVGKLRACVYFLDSLAVKDIEDRFIAASASAVAAPPPLVPSFHGGGIDVELAGGEMSLSPSPTKVDASTMTRAAEREAALRSLSRGLRFDDGDEANDERKTKTMSTSHSSDSLKPPPGDNRGVVPPMASYTSPNNQRYDAAPNSAPTSGPAPIYGFKAAPVKTTTTPPSGGTTASRNIIGAEVTQPRLPGRRPMASCLKIDVGTSMEQQTQQQQQPISVAVVPSKQQQTTPEPSVSPTTPRASPIACSPGLPHARHSSANASRHGASRHGVGAASPSWGGLGCPESPIPSLGTSPSLPSRFSSGGGGSRRSSWSPSSSLGTSLRDVVGVYPHSPGAFGRRVSGGGTLPEDGGSPPVGPNGDDANAYDDVEFAPFALDDENSAGGATFVEHTPADLLSLLEAPSRLRRKDTDGPLPLDAALEDSTDSIVNKVESAGTGIGAVKAQTEDKATTSQRRADRDADSAERVTLASALVELENLRLIRDRMSCADA